MTTSKEFNTFVCAMLASALNKACALSGENGWKVSVTDAVLPSDENPPVRDHISVSGEVSGMFGYETTQADLDRIAGVMANKDPRDLANALRDELLATLSKKYKSIKAELKVAEKLDPATNQTVTLAAAKAGTTPLTFTMSLTSALYDAINNPAPAPAAVQGEASNKLNLVLDVELNVMLRFGQRQMALSDILDLKMGSVVELDRKVEEPVELLLDGTVVARGEAVIIDGNYGLRITEVLQPMASQFVN